MKKLLLAAALGTSALAGVAAAQAGTPPQRQPGMARADANNDGIVTREEFLAQVEQRFQRLDTNRDGQLSAEERRAGRPERRAGPRRGGGDRRAAMMAQYDTDRDGQLSDTERQAAQAAMQQRMLQRFDTNLDGQLSDAERQAARTAMQAQRANAPDGQMRGARGGRGGTMRAQMLARFDTDKDGQLSDVERQAARTAMQQRMLERYDSNRDGQLSDAERQAARAAMLARRPGGPGAPGAGPAAPGAAPGGPGMAGPRGDYGARMLARVDTDGNGMISLAEQRTVATARFDRIDANKDGRIDQAEMTALQQRAQQMRMQRMQRMGPPAGAPLPAPDAPPPAPQGG